MITVIIWIGRNSQAHEIVPQLWWYDICAGALHTETSIRRRDHFVVVDEPGSWRLFRKVADWLRCRQAETVVALFRRLRTT